MAAYTVSPVVVSMMLLVMFAPFAYSRRSSRDSSAQEEQSGDHPRARSLPSWASQVKSSARNSLRRTSSRRTSSRSQSIQNRRKRSEEIEDAIEYEDDGEALKPAWARNSLRNSSSRTKRSKRGRPFVGASLRRKIKDDAPHKSVEELADKLEDNDDDDKEHLEPVESGGHRRNSFSRVLHRASNSIRKVRQKLPGPLLSWTTNKDDASHKPEEEVEDKPEDDDDETSLELEQAGGVKADVDEEADIEEAVPACCSGCDGGKNFCSTHSGRCYATKAKDHYAECPVAEAEEDWQSFDDEADAEAVPVKYRPQCMQLPLDVPTDANHSLVTVTVHRGVNLPMQKGCLGFLTDVPDGYVFYGPKVRERGDLLARTRVIKNSHTPQWEDNCTFVVTTQHPSPLGFRLFDYNGKCFGMQKMGMKDEDMGHAVMPIRAGKDFVKHKVPFFSNTLAKDGTEPIPEIIVSVKWHMAAPATTSKTATSETSAGGGTDAPNEKGIALGRMPTRLASMIAASVAAAVTF